MAESLYKKNHNNLKHMNIILPLAKEYRIAA